jgi:RimJ/RimL family protein N-acetyltransferase
LSTTETLRLLKPGDEAALETFLARHAAASMFLRSNLRAAGLEDRGDLYQATYAALFQASEIVAVAAHAWNGNLLLQAPLGVERVSAAAVEASARPVGGILGPADQVKAARRGLGLETRGTTTDSLEELFHLGIDRLQVPKDLRSGRVVCRRSRDEDHPLLAQWRIAYEQEALGRRATPELGRQSRAEVEQRCGDGCLFVLEAEGELVACCSFNARLPDMVQVGGAFTPLLKRRRGFARAVVAGALLSAREDGVTGAILFTNAENQPAQLAYHALGFERVGDYKLVLFVS